LIRKKCGLIVSRQTSDPVGTMPTLDLSTWLYCYIR